MNVNSRNFPEQKMLLWRYEKYRAGANPDRLTELVRGTAEDLGWQGSSSQHRISGLLWEAAVLSRAGMQLTRPVYLRYAHSLHTTGAIPATLRPVQTATPL